MAENKTTQLRKLIFANHEARFSTPKVKKGDFILVYVEALKEKMEAENANHLNQKDKNKVLSLVVKSLMAHWKVSGERDLEDRSEYLKLLKQTQKLYTDSYDDLKNKGLYLSDASWIESKKLEMQDFLEFEDVKPRRKNREVKVV